MDKVTVNKNELLATLRENRDKHVETYERAAAGYRERAIRLLNERLELAKSEKNFDLHFNLQEPTDHTDEYNQAIKMLEMSVEDHVVITDYEFRQFVMDKWNWKDTFVTTTSMYIN